MGQTINELQNGGEPKKNPNLVSNPKVKYLLLPVPWHGRLVWDALR